MYAPKFRHWMSDHERVIERRVPEIQAEIREMAAANREWLDKALPEPAKPVWHFANAAQTLKDLMRGPRYYQDWMPGSQNMQTAQHIINGHARSQLEWLLGR